MNAFSKVNLGLKRAAYSSSQLMRIAWYTGHYAVGRRKMGPLTNPGDAPYAEHSLPLDRHRLRQSFQEVFQKDWRNIKEGIYRLPPEIKSFPNFARAFKTSRDYLIDSEKVARRKSKQIHSEIYTQTVKDKYPRYFLQNFHYQSDGWLSNESAERYDMQVETIFTGAAGPMRRVALPFIADFISNRPETECHLLDMGVGTGCFLKDVKHNWSKLNITALDLSPAYLEKARATLGQWENIEFVRGAAESTNFKDQSFDIITAVYLFHELPPKVRVQVAKEVARLLKPGGRFILIDTIQYNDEPGLDILLENFPRGFHEPYYESYCKTDLAQLFEGAELEKVDEDIGFLTKASVFEKSS